MEPDVGKRALKGIKDARVMFDYQIPTEERTHVALMVPLGKVSSVLDQLKEHRVDVKRFHDF